MGTVSMGTIEYFYLIGEAWAHLMTRFLPDNPVVCDLGCGCGKMARFLYLNPNIRYVGIDIFLPSIKWCREAFAHVHDTRFRFVHFDGYSTVWNPNGKILSNNFVLPIEDCSVNFVVAGSLFTHLLEEECKHYLDEIKRILKPGGLALISIHDKPKEGARFSGDHSRIDISYDYFLSLTNERLLSLKEDIGNFLGQRTILFESIKSV